MDIHRTRASQEAYSRRHAGTRPALRFIAAILAAAGLSATPALAMKASWNVQAREHPAQIEGDAGSTGMPVDLELVLAVDTSGSMSKAELLIQRRGYIAALRHADVAVAIAMRGAVAVAYLEWAGPDDQRIVVPWTVLSDATDAAGLADKIDAAPLSPGFNSPPWKSGTSIGSALSFAADMFSSGGASHTIDISGNGPNNAGDALAPVREDVVARGITINGLPIARLGDIGSGYPLAVYYEDCVIGGPGAFAIAVDNQAAFEMAVRRKLVQEIAGIPQRLASVALRPAPAPRIDCARAGT